MKKLFFVVLILWLLQPCTAQSQFSAFIRDFNYIDSIHDYQLAHLDTQLNMMFKTWSEDLKPIPLATIKNAKHKEVYKVFRAFYDPLDLNKIYKKKNWDTDEDGLYNNIQYLIIQNRIDYKIADKNDSTIFKDSIIGFRPELSFEPKKILYLNARYDTLLNKFLGNDHYPLGYGGIMNPARPKNKSAERRYFLYPYIQIIYGHWGGYWHLESHPYVFSIKFNEKMDEATVNFRLVYEGGEAKLKKKRGEWKVSDYHLTWIE